MPSPSNHSTTLASLFRQSDWPSLLTFIQSNPEPSLYTQTLPCGHTPLQLASLLGSPTTVSALLNLGLRIDPSSLFNAATHAHLDIIRLLLQPTPDTATCTKSHCNCPTKVPAAGRALHAAAWTVSSDAANAILQALCPAGKLAALAYRAHDGGMPLHVAALSGDARLVRAFVEAGADMFARDHTDRTPRDWAKRYVVAAGSGQDVVDTLVQAENKANAARAWAQKKGSQNTQQFPRLCHERDDTYVQKVVDDESCFSDRKPCVPAKTQQTTTTTTTPPPACHAA